MDQSSDKVIHISPLPSGITSDFIKKLFADCGPIKNVIIREKNHSNFAFVTFEKAESALKAIREYNYTKLNGIPIVITPTTQEYQNLIKSGQGNVFVKGLDEYIEISQLHELFQTYGEVISCKLPTLPGGKNKGFGYVQFRRPSDAERAITELNGATINGKKITVEKYKKKDRTQSNTAVPPPIIEKPPRLQSNGFDDTYTNIYIRNLPGSIQSSEDLKTMFSEFGLATSAKLMPDGQSGFCNMIDHQAAVRAVQSLNGSVKEGKVLEVVPANKDKNGSVSYSQTQNSKQPAGLTVLKPPQPTTTSTTSPITQNQNQANTNNNSNNSSSNGTPTLNPNQSNSFGSSSTTTFGSSLTNFMQQPVPSFGFSSPPQNSFNMQQNPYGVTQPSFNQSSFNASAFAPPKQTQDTATSQPQQQQTFNSFQQSQNSGFMPSITPYTPPNFTPATSGTTSAIPNPVFPFGTTQPSAIYGSNMYDPSALSQQVGNSNIYGAPPAPRGTQQFPISSGANTSSAFGMQYGSNPQYGIPAMQGMNARQNQQMPFGQAPFGSNMTGNFGAGSIFRPPQQQQQQPQQQQQQQQQKVYSASNK